MLSNRLLLFLGYSRGSFLGGDFWCFSCLILWSGLGSRCCCLISWRASRRCYSFPARASFFLCRYLFQPETSRYSLIRFSQAFSTLVFPNRCASFFCFCNLIFSRFCSINCSKSAYSLSSSSPWLTLSRTQRSFSSIYRTNPLYQGSSDRLWIGGRWVVVWRCSTRLLGLPSRGNLKSDFQCWVRRMGSEAGRISPSAIIKQLEEGLSYLCNQMRSGVGQGKKKQHSAEYHRIFQFRIMKAGFITAPDAEERNLEMLRQLIHQLVMTMPPTELCQQAAINLALPTNMLDFARVLRLSNSQGNLSTLQFTALQLRNLHKEVSRLKCSSPCADFDHTATATHRHIRRATRQQTVKQQTTLHPQSEYWSILEDEAAKRNKLQLLCSHEKIDKKMEQLRKKAEKVKAMNKRALKIFKNQQQKEQKKYEHFILEPAYCPAPNHLPIPTAQFNSSFMQEHKTQQFIDVTKVGDVEQSKDRIDTNFQTENLYNHEKYDEYRRKELKTREKRRAIEESNQSQALLKVIKKQEKIRALRTAHERKKTEQIQSQRDSEGQIKSKIKDEQQRELNLTQKIHFSEMRRELHIKERVNRIREELKEKEQRRERHRQLIEEYTHKIAHENNQTSFSHLKLQLTEELSRKQQTTIRSRYQQLRQKQNLRRLAISVAKLSNTQLHRALQIKTQPPLSQLVLTG